MRRHIPSTQALVCFEAAARHQSFTLAAQELALTQGAVCRQIAGLEEALGISLFRRARRGVVLTDAGRIYARQVTGRLDAIERDTLALMSQQGHGMALELAVVPTFATRWLLPRLPHFSASHPGITLHLTTRTRPFMFDDTPFDAAIYCGDGNWPGTRAVALMPERSVPVCSPRLLGAVSMTSPDRIATLPLLQQSTRPHAWRQWFADHGITTQRDMTGPRLELFSMLAQAAIQGLGVALIPPMLIDEELADGRLCIAHPDAVPSRLAYWLIIPDRAAGIAALATFSVWLRSQCEAK